MEIKIRPIESLCVAVENMQAQRKNKMLAKGGKLLSAIGTPPPDPTSGLSNLNDWGKLDKYIETFKYKYANKIDNFMPNINKQNLTRLLKYLA